MLPNVLLLKASHGSLEIFEGSPVLIYFGSAVEDKIGPIFSPNGPTFAFEVVCDRNNLLDLQIFWRQITKYHKTIAQIHDMATNAAHFDTPVFINNTLH